MTLEKKRTDNMENVSDSILELLRKDIAEIKLALLGNEYNPTAGLVYRTCEAERQIEKLRVRFDRMLWTASGAAIILSVTFNLIMAYFDKVVLK
jgi:hypothetical protein